jgi:hypothetical protein
LSDLAAEAARRGAGRLLAELALLRRISGLLTRLRGRRLLAELARLRTELAGLRRHAVLRLATELARLRRLDDAGVEQVRGHGGRQMPGLPSPGRTAGSASRPAIRNSAGNALDIAK